MWHLTAGPLTLMLDDDDFPIVFVVSCFRAVESSLDYRCEHGVANFVSVKLKFPTIERVAKKVV